MTRKIVFFLDAGFAGMDSHEFSEYNDDVTDEQLNRDAWQLALDNAAMYGVYPLSEYPEGMDEETDDGDIYTDNIEGYWEDYDPEKHDMYSVSGTPVWNNCTH